MNSYIFKKETWVYFFSALFACLVLILVLPISVGVSNKDFIVVLDYGDGTEKKFTGDVNGSISAWDTLQQASANDIIVVDPGPDFYPKAIDSLENGNSGKNWELYVNGKMVSEPPINVNIKDGDMVVWKFE